MDMVRVALILNLMALGITLLSAGVLAWNNISSRNLALATGALCGAVILYLIQLVFELTAIHERYGFTAQITIDRLEPSIGQIPYTDQNSWRKIYDNLASNWLAKQEPEVFAEDRKKLSSDFVLYSIIAELVEVHCDWQLKVKMLQGRSGMAVVNLVSSSPTECTQITMDALHSILERAGNVCAHVPFAERGREICLPPNSELRMAPSSAEISNPFCQVSFSLNVHDKFSGHHPISQEVVRLADGSSRYETRFVDITMDVAFSRVRSNHRSMPKYRGWTERLASELAKWFE